VNDSSTAKDISVLVVDDDEQLRNMYSRMLRDERYTLRVADTPNNVLQIMESSPVAVLVTDNEMPDMNGNELCRIVSEKYPLATRIMVSGSRMPEDLRSHYFIQKPIMNCELKKAVLKGVDEYLERIQEKPNP
jgi:CheY-like chemotaxis protein